MGYCWKCGERGFRRSGGDSELCPKRICPNFKQPIMKGYKKQARSSLFTRTFDD